jgi:hypothetical protein
MNQPGYETGGVPAIRRLSGKPVEFHQVGKANLDGDPLAREVRAIKDINCAKPDIPVDYHPYNR